MVVARARRPEELQDVVERYKEGLRAVRQDVTDSEEVDAAVARAIQAFGRLDVLVNNAGYAQFAPFEQMSAGDFKGIIDTCFYGVVNTTRAALPVMRKQRSGVIFQVSSVGGRVTRPGNSPYHAAKWAVSGFAEALAHEASVFGVQVCALERGVIRTNWAKRANSVAARLLAEYEENVGNAIRALANYWGQENSDPKLIADLIVNLAEENALPPHLLLGSDAYAISTQAMMPRGSYPRSGARQVNPSIFGAYQAPTSEGETKRANSPGKLFEACVFVHDEDFRKYELHWRVLTPIRVHNRWRPKLATEESLAHGVRLGGHPLQDASRALVCCSLRR